MAQDTVLEIPTNSIIPGDLRRRINANLVEGERLYRLRFISLGAVIVAAAVAAGAFFVDYVILSEFWTRALANEFLEVPSSLAGSVTFKSLQVLFAALAAHMLISQLPEFGRKIFIALIFGLAIMMLTGLGLLFALMNLPGGAEAMSSNSLGDALSSLGLGAGAASAPAAEEGGFTGWMRQLETAEPLLWMASLGVVFLLVTGVGAICLHIAQSSLRSYVDAAIFKHRRRAAEALAAKEAEYQAANARYFALQDPEKVKALLWNRLMSEARAYEKGLVEFCHNEGLSGAVRKTRKGFGGSPAEVMNRFRDQRTVEAYHRAFENWREKYSKLARGATSGVSESVPPELFESRNSSGRVVEFPNMRQDAAS